MTDLKKVSAAYFSLEFGIIDEIRTYAGGLGILAGDTVKTAADLEMDFCGVTLLYKKGYFKQKLSEDGEQLENADTWDYASILENTGKKIEVELKNEKITAEIWVYNVVGLTGHIVPVYFLNADIAENSDTNRYISYNLYTPYNETRLRQEILFGKGGVLALKALGENPENYHINESHGVFALTELQKKYGENLKKAVVFTTHTPEEHGHKKYELSYLSNFLKDEDIQFLGNLSENNLLNTTIACIKSAKFTNAVSKRHSEVTKKMFPNFNIDYVTNGIHAYSWVSKELSSLFDKKVPEWRISPEYLYKFNAPLNEFAETVSFAKKRLIDYVNSYSTVKFDEQIFTIGFGRRVDLYKRSNFIFKDLNKLLKIAEKNGGLQIILSGKAYFNHLDSENRIKELFNLTREDLSNLKIVFLEDYSINIASLMIQGSDIWLNNPIKPREACGTSGMKAALNGVPSFSTLDGWWAEGWIEEVTGWSIGNNDYTDFSEEEELNELYMKLEQKILFKFKDKNEWNKLRISTIAYNASRFNTHRMLKEYFQEGYSPTS